jgi:histidyl-tRNA synthetase
MAQDQIQRAPGTRDFYPQDMRIRAQLFARMRGVAARFGYEEYDGPLLEPYDLYAAKSGGALVAEEMYTLTDRGGRLLGLRPEMTPTLARMVAQRQGTLRKPIKWFSLPTCWRYERPQKGRLREHVQWNVDVLGVDGAEAEAEIIAVFVTFLRELGLTQRDIRVRIGHRGWLSGQLARLDIPEGAQLAVLRAIDRREKVTPDAFGLLLRDARLDTRQIADLTTILDGCDYGDFAPLRELMALLAEYGLAGYCAFDPTIVRGLAYYTSTVYEIWDARREFRAIAGGGRYDDLTVALGGEPLPGAGMAMGDVVLGLLLQRVGLLPGGQSTLDVFVARHSEQQNGESIRLAQRLRQAGLRVDRSLKVASLGAQLGQAEAQCARVAIILAPDEMARGEAVVRDLQSREQETVGLDDVERRVRAMLDIQAAG